jgi:hypothetical protein
MSKFWATPASTGRPIDILRLSIDLTLGQPVQSQYNKFFPSLFYIPVFFWPFFLL